MASEVQGGSVRAVQWVGWSPEMASGAGHLLPSGLRKSHCYDKCLNKFGNYVEKQRTDAQRYLSAFLVFTYHHSRKKN
jgi:hypothetical protein